MPASDVQLRDVAQGDLPVFFEHQSDPQACAMVAFESRDREAFGLHWEKILKDDAITKRTILAGAQVAGHLVCFERGGVQEVGYWLGREFWGKGIATRALAAFLPLVETCPLYAVVAQHNLGSLRVLAKCGFTPCTGDEKLPDSEGAIALRLG